MFTRHTPEQGSMGLQQGSNQARCRRGSSSPASPTLSSYSSSEGTSLLTGDVDDLTSLMTASDGNLRADDDTMTSDTETLTMGVSELAAFLEADSLLLGDAEKMVLQLWGESEEDVEQVDKLYKPLFDCVVKNKRQQVYRVSQRLSEDEQCSVTVEKEVTAEHALCMPSLAVVVFLREENFTGEDTWAIMKEHFAGSAWRFHHSEAVSRGKLHAYENNSQDYLIARRNMPLCAMRQNHCGKRLLRLLRFVTSDNWRDNVNLYSLLLAKDPDILKSDFCLFTASYHREYDVQLALKKIPTGIQCETTPGAALCFRVSQVGHTVPLLPNMCTPVTSDRWRTTDLDGNVIFLDVIRMRDRSCEPVPESTDLNVSHHLLTPVSHRSQPAGVCVSKGRSSNQTFNGLCVMDDNRGSKAGGRAYSQEECDSYSITSSEFPDILDYDSLDDVELLISEVGSTCSEAVNFMDVNGDLMKVSERDACGAVDGSSYHSEGNHEDQQQTPSPVSKTRPAVPPKPLRVLDKSSKCDYSQSRDNTNDDVHSSGSSSKSELLKVSQTCRDVSEKHGRRSSDSSPLHLSSAQKVQASSPSHLNSAQIVKASSPSQVQIGKEGIKAYQKPTYWAGVSESLANSSDSKLADGNSKNSPALPKQQLKTDTGPMGKGVTDRPALPSYSELKARTVKSQIQQGAGAAGRGYHERRGSYETLLEDHGVYCETVTGSSNLTPHRSDNSHAPVTAHGGGWQQAGWGLQVSSRSQKATSTPPPTNRTNSGTKSNTGSTPPPPYRPPVASPAVVVVNRTPPSYTAATSGVKKQEPLHRASPQDSQISAHSQKQQRFRFDGATMPRFGRNSKLRQSVVPPPCFNREYPDFYEEQAIDVPGVPTVYSERKAPVELDSSTVGFYV